MPELVNFVTQTPGLSSMAKRAAGMAPERDFPTFAPMTLRDWHRRRGERNPGGPKVVLWPDTFTNHLHTEVGVAAVEALESAGFRVVMPQGHLCCGRPLYDYGMLKLARRYLERVLAELRDEIRAGTPVVGVEPSCTAVFRDELPKLLPGDEDGRRLCKQTFHFAEFLERHAEGWEPPRLERTAVLHGHCHHRATGGVDSEQKLLERMGVQVEKLETTCCGMAGSWGFEAGHHDLSMKIGEHSLLPQVRRAGGETLIVADGFSCRTQIEQARVGRQALHVAQAIQLALDHGPAGPRGAPEAGVRAMPR
jgi:Fe-S oxidoreductase